MPIKPANKTLQQLIVENEDLRAKLDEAEDTLRAIRSGEVDALVVLGEHGERIFTLQGADRSYRLLMEEMNEGALSLTKAGLIVYANRCLVGMLKTQLEKLIGSFIQSWIAPDSWMSLDVILQKGEVPKRRTEMVFTASDGTRVPVLLSVNQLLIDDMPDFFHMVVTDLTEHMQAEDALRQSDERLRLIFKTQAEGVALNEMIFNEAGAAINYKIIEVNDAFYRVADFRKDYPVIGSLATELYGLQVETISSFWESHKDMTETQYTEMISPVNQRVFGISTSCLVNNRFVTSFLDITARKLAEAELSQAHALLEQHVDERTSELKAANVQLEQAARMKDEFLASMSHELRTPLTGILGLAEIMQMPGHDPLTEKQEKFLGHILNSGRHLLELINDILDISKLGAGKFELVQQPCSLAELCQMGLQTTAASAVAGGLQTSFSISPDVIVLWADARRLRQIIINLLSNAIKFTPTGGSLGIEARGDLAAGQVYITVWDTGIGITEADLARLFQSFVQLDARLSRKYPGTGLGLVLARRLAELHGGSVSVESKPGSGSRFTVRLPWLMSGPANSSGASVTS